MVLSFRSIYFLVGNEYLTDLFFSKKVVTVFGVANTPLTSSGLTFGMFYSIPWQWYLPWRLALVWPGWSKHLLNWDFKHFEDEWTRAMRWWLGFVAHSSAEFDMTFINMHNYTCSMYTWKKRHPRIQPYTGRHIRNVRQKIYYRPWNFVRDNHTGRLALAEKKVVLYIMAVVHPRHIALAQTRPNVSNNSPMCESEPVHSRVVRQL